MAEYERIPDYPADQLADYAIGQTVRHRRYGYRGLIADYDMRCRASDEWYQRNQSQPDRDQPWYHVLVDGSDVVTYAAQTSLEPDPAPDPVVHPLINVFFDLDDEGELLRNDTPWPGN